MRVIVPGDQLPLACPILTSRYGTVAHAQNACCLHHGDLKPRPRLAELVEWPLHARVEGPQLRKIAVARLGRLRLMPSYAVGASLVNAVVTAVSVRLRRNSVAHLRAAEKLWDEFGTYAES